MLGYDLQDLQEMINAVEESKSFYLKYPSDLMDKTTVETNLTKASTFLQGLWAEGYFDGYEG
jgi:hypothetical protein